MSKVTDLVVRDIRFPTSRLLDGSDAMNRDPDYSATYVVICTDMQDGLEGHGLTFTIGRGNELCVAAVNSLKSLIIGKDTESLFGNMGNFWRMMVADSQFRWVGPEKGVIHLATAAIVNAVWDLYAKTMKKPLWKLLSDMSPEEIVSCIDFSYITDALMPEEAIDILKAKWTSREKRMVQMKENGFPAYVTSVGWLGYANDKIKRLCEETIAANWSCFKMKVGLDMNDNLQRATVIRKAIGNERKLMMDANQVWGVNEAIDNIRRLAAFNPWWVEEPTNPDDILGHKSISQAVAPIRIATGEHCHNRIMFKQFLQSKAIQFCQIDCCRLGGINEALAVLLMAAKFKVPVCPHTGGVGLCEYMQHLSLFDYICVGASLDDRMLEYVDHLHEHFIYPVVIQDGHYMPPQHAGCNVDLHADSISKYEFPNGCIWHNKR